MKSFFKFRSQAGNWSLVWPLILFVLLASRPIARAQTGIDDLSVKSYGATGNGTTDDTTAFQNALAAAAAGKNNGIYVPMGQYVISSSLVLSNLEMVGKFSGGWPADSMPMPALLIHQLTAPGLILQEGASVRGVSVYYNGGTPTTTNAPAISLQGEGITLESLRIQYPYDGITTPVSATPNRARFSDIFIVQPTHIGVQISKCVDYVQMQHVEVWCNAAFSTGPGFNLGAIAGGSFNGLLAYQCTPGIQIYEDFSPGGGPFTGNLVNCCTDASTTGLNIIGDDQVKVTAGDWDCEFWGATINGTNAQVSIIGGKWHANSQEPIMVTQAKNVIIDSDIFYRSTPYGTGWTNNPMVSISKAVTATVNGCQFLPGSTGLILGSQVQRAVVVGNSFEEGSVINQMTTTNLIISNNLY